MRYLSICSGIEAASVAWRPLGWRAWAVAEIEAFPSVLLKHHYPDTPNLGDITAFKDWPDADVSLLVGGTPCQSFSVAGLRKGLADPRGNLALTYLAIADRYRPEWLVWENVPGVLSSSGGRDFGAFLGGLQQLGYGFAYRVLDAQYVRVDGFDRAVPQRRRRVFVVGNLRDWRRAAAVLFEPESLSGNPPPRREAGQGIARPISAGSPRGSGYRNDADTADNLVAFGGNATGGSHGRLDFESETFVCAPPLTGNQYGDHESREGLLVAHALRADGFDASEDGTGRGTPLIAVADTLVSNGDAHSGYRDEKGTIPINLQVATRHEALGRGTGFGVGESGDPAFTILKDHHHAVAFNITPSNSNKDYNARATEHAQSITGGGNRPSARGGDLITQAVPVADTLGVSANQTTGFNTEVVSRGWAVRRLTPTECEKLQGFPPGYTAVPYRGKPAADGPRYKALGNSMAVNCMRWIGRRIELVQGIVSTLEKAA